MDTRQLTPSQRMRLLALQASAAADMIDSGLVITATEPESATHKSRYGEGAVCVGDFVVFVRDAFRKPV